tara:strand:- start:1784 stop:1951 length:168 start_codon:yes stop_codon:yes gene_type:complete
MAKRPNKKKQQEYKRAIYYGCVVCNREFNGLFSEATIHHLTGGGMGMKSEDFIPL